MNNMFHIIKFTQNRVKDVKSNKFVFKIIIMCLKKAQLNHIIKENLVRRNVDIT